MSSSLLGPNPFPFHLGILYSPNLDDFFQMQVDLSVFAADFDERHGLITCKRGVFSQSAQAEPSEQRNSG